MYITFMIKSLFLFVGKMILVMVAITALLFTYLGCMWFIVYMMPPELDFLGAIIDAILTVVFVIAACVLAS